MKRLPNSTNISMTLISHNYLRRQKHVADFHLAEFGEGDAGVTIVTFKK